MQCMTTRQCTIELQTDCVVTVVAPVVRLPDSHVYALWPKATGCLPCNSRDYSNVINQCSVLES